MFASRGLFQTLRCPQDQDCTRLQCIFSHRSDLPQPRLLDIPVDEPKIPSSTSLPAAVSGQRNISETLHTSTKRALSPVRRVSEPSSSSSSYGEPPRKLQKLGSIRKPIAVPSSSSSTSGAPVLRVNAAQSIVPLPVRQTMLKSIYDHLVVLYENILSENPSIASEHALKQEEEVYKQSSKLTYRNAVIQCIARLKKRPPPDSSSHPSVGTEAEIAARAESQNALKALRLTREHLEPYVLSMADLEKWGYMVDLPEGPGGHQPSKEGEVVKCERCGQPFSVRRDPPPDECFHHYGKASTRNINGERIRVYNCCGKATTDAEGCVRGPHVFYERNPADLHARHAFSFLQPPANIQTVLDVVALDCEMVYTTGGMRVARVSVVDGAGNEIFDEQVRMDDGVVILDYITRFSGITEAEHSKALLPLASIRKSLDSLINTNTILIGHALDNDLKTLRIVHRKCVDTAILFKHPAGAPYRRALRDLAREHLNIRIQKGGGSVGHSSVEDSVATLDLVRWHILNKPKPKPEPPPMVPAVDPFA